ncbi:acyltransferase family protein [Hungatella hathewayi]|jgi:peptidoglycan/LPS O-acetylase OafA/YrhL|uniref:acyltransferase family protein n=1 Tax=Hungatella hathewayi TaxID=154046 RepID=UPI0011DDA105|nr:acyltransferase [Hungatella hathewayi]
MVVFSTAVIATMLLSIASIKGKNENFELLSRSYTDVLRGIAILLILLHHAETNLYKELPHIFKVFIPLGAFGTAIFFFLSGYGNYTSLNKRKYRGGDWLIKKAGRLVVSYIIVIVIYTIILFLLGDSLVSKANIADYVLNVLKLTIPPFTSWYIKIQFLAYLLHFIVSKFYKGMSEAVALVILLAVYTVIMRITKYEDFWWTSALCYGIGAIVATKKELVRKYLSKPVITIFCTTAMLLFYLCSLRFHQGTLLMCIAGVLALSGIGCFMEVKGKTLRWIGNMSYELYLTQVALIYIVLQKSEINISFRMIIYLVISVSVAYGIEKISGSVMNLIIAKET